MTGLTESVSAGVQEEKRPSRHWKQICLHCLSSSSVDM